MLVKDVACDTISAKSFVNQTHSYIIPLLLTLPMYTTNSRIRRDIAQVNHKIPDRAKKIVLVDVPIDPFRIIRVRIYIRDPQY